MLAIFKREFKSFFHSVIGFVFLAANLFLLGLYFYAYNLKGAYPYLAVTLSASAIIFIITIPLLTMRIISEDRKNKTDQLILTSPVSIAKIVLGKYLAVAAVYAIFIAIVSLYPLILGMFGKPYYRETHVAILGFALYGLAGIAIGLFISSITESQIIAAVLSFVVLFLTYLMSGICSLISQTGNWLTRILDCLNLAKRFDSFLQGTLEIGAIVYFISIIVLMLFLTGQSIQKRRYNVSAKNLKMGAYSVGAIIVAIVAVVFINLIVTKIPEKYTIFDVTTNKLYTISDDTKTLLRSIKKDVTIYVYGNKDNLDVNVVEILRRYEGESSHVKVEYVDPVSNPQFYKAYSSTEFDQGEVVVVSGDKFRTIAYEELFVIDYSFDYTTYNYSSTIKGLDAEGQLTSAVAFVTSNDSHTIYFAKGHGETDYDADFTDLIMKANVSKDDLMILTEDAIPEDCECLVINNPSGDYTEDEIKKITTYVEAGGNVIISLYAAEKEQPNLYGFLKTCGLIVTNDLVMDSSRRNYYQSPFYLLPTVQNTAVTSLVYNQYYVFAPYSLAMKVAEELPDGVTVNPILVTSDSSFAKSMATQITSYSKAEGDVEGPFTIAAEVTKTTGDNSSTIIVTSCSYLFTKSADQTVSGGNVKLFSGVITNMIHLENNISIPAKSFEIDYLTVTQANAATWRTITMFIVPIGLLIIGLLVWLRRRKK